MAKEYTIPDECQACIHPIHAINGVFCTWIVRWVRETGLPVDLRQYRYKSAGYRHLPLRVKRELLRQITGFRERSVCEDVEQHFAYWQEAVNNNRNDCCNLKR